MDKAYNTYREGVDEGEEPKSFSDWCKQVELESPQFHYWSLTLHFQLTIRPVFEGKELSTLQGCLQIASAVVFCFKPQPLREVAASSYSRYGMS